VSGRERTRRWNAAARYGGIVLLCASALDARAAEEGVELEWTAPTDCPGPSAAQQEIASASPPGTRLLPTSVSVSIQHQEDGFHGFVTVRAAGRVRTRELVGTSCAEVADAIAVVVSLLVTEVQGSAPAAPPPAVSAPPPPAAQTATPQATEPRPARSSGLTDAGPAARKPRADARRPAADVRVRSGLGVGLLPDTSVGIAAAAGVNWGAFRSFVELDRWEGVHPEVERSGVPIASSRLGLGGTFCVGGSGRVAVEGCAGARAVMLEASSDDVEDETRDSGWFPAALLRSGVAWSVSDALRLGTDLELQAPLRRVLFRREPNDVVYALPFVAPAGLVTVTWSP
jgi:hypothetical protein